MKEILAKIIIVYYLWLLPYLGVFTAYVYEWGWSDYVELFSLIMWLIPVLNWLVFIGLLLEPDALGLTVGLILKSIIICGIAGISIVLLAVLWQRKKDQKLYKLEQQAEELSRIQKHKADQQKYRESMEILGRQSLMLSKEIPVHMNSAEKWLDQAELEFAESAYAPFWDSIEKATKCLARFDEDVRHLIEYSSSYSKLIKSYEDTPPAFPFGSEYVKRLAVGSATAERLKYIVRTAQRNFQFAMIYEQRKTNQILVTGFTNLQEALQRMTDQIILSIEGLSNSIEIMTSTLDQSIQSIHSELIHFHKDYSDEISARENRKKG